MHCIEREGRKVKRGCSEMKHSFEMSRPQARTRINVESNILAEDDYDQARITWHLGDAGHSQKACAIKHSIHVWKILSFRN